MALVFFIGKKDGKKYIVQDYQYLNKWTIKNNYLLPLISDIIENIGIKKVFTKLDLQWGYNNIQIKERDKWKTVFMTPEGLFEPTVMFFGLTNSLVTFQMIINKILWDLINTGEVASFINNIIVGTEEEEEYNKIVEEVIKRLTENNLYIKLGKCKYKVREVGFLGVVIGPEEIKMKKEKIKEVLEQITPKEVKDLQKFLELANYYQQFIKNFAMIARLLMIWSKKIKSVTGQGDRRKCFKS